MNIFNETIYNKWRVLYLYVYLGLRTQRYANTFPVKGTSVSAINVGSFATGVGWIGWKGRRSSLVYS